MFGWLFGKKEKKETFRWHCMTCGVGLDVICYDPQDPDPFIECPECIGERVQRIRNALRPKIRSKDDVS